MDLGKEDQARFEALDAAEALRQAMVRGGDVAKAREHLAARGDVLFAPADEAPDAAATHGLDVPAYSPEKRKLGRETTGIVARARLRMTHVPLSMVDVTEPSERPLVTVEVENARTEALRVRVSAQIEGFSARAVESREIAKNDRQPCTVHLLPTFLPVAVTTLTRPVRAAVHVSVVDLDFDKTEDERTFRVWLLPPTTAVLREKDPSTGKWTSLSDYLAGWVTPDEPSVMDMLRKAADRTPGKMIRGYQVDQCGVKEQVRAIFEALKDHGITYVNSVAAAGAANAFVQRIRFPKESLRDRAANCIDGTVLYASLMEAASLEAGIVVVPGHAYVAWRDRRATLSGAWRFIETTMTGSHDFDDAVAQGAANHATFSGKSQERILDLAELRRRGFLPMG